MNLRKGGKWEWGTMIPAAWKGQQIGLDVETFQDGSPRLIGLGVPGSTLVCRPTPKLYRAMEAHTGGWCAYSMNADRHFAATVGLKLKGRIDDPMLMVHLIDENVPSSLKETAPHFCGYPDWFSEIKGARIAKHRDDIPDEEFGEYNAYDISAMLALRGFSTSQFGRHPQWYRVYEYISRPLSDALYHTEAHGIPLDGAKTEAYLEALRVKKGLQEARLSSHGPTINWRSPMQVSQLLYDEMKLPEQHNWKTDGRTTDMNALEALRGQHPIIEDAILYRKNDQRIKMLEGWMKRLVGGRLHSRYNITGATTGRISGEDPNPQNFPTDRVIRSLVVAPPGYSIVAADYKTLEIGGAAWQYGENQLMQAYLTGDPHTATATEILGRAPADKQERKIYGKTPNFRLLYQQKGPSFFEGGRKDGIAWTLHDATSIRTSWHALYPGVRLAWNRIGNLLSRDGYLETYSGRWRRLPEIHSERKQAQNHAWRQGTNAVVQTPCGEFCHVACIIAVDALRELGATLILDVHDSLVFIVPTEKATEAARLLKAIMETEVPRYFARHLDRVVDLPLFAEVAVGPSWGEAVELDKMASGMLQ